MSRLSTLWRISLLHIFLLTCLGFQALSQAPQGINYQAVARNADGNPLADTSLNVTITLAQDSQLVVSEFIETHVVSTNAYGLFTIVIGDGTPTLGSLSAVTWSSSPIFINVQIGSLDMGTSELQSVPYALFAQEVAGGLDDGDWDTSATAVYTNKNVGIGVTAPLGNLSIGDQSDAATIGLRGVGNAFNYSGIWLESSGPFQSWSMTHRSDPQQNHGLLFEYSPDGTNYFSRLFIDSNGNVGIGSTDPEALLHVTGKTLTDTLEINGAYILPWTDGLPGDVMVTDGAGNITWQAPADSLEGFELINDTTLRITEGNGQAYDVSLGNFVTEAQLQSLATQVATNQDSIQTLAGFIANNTDSINDLSDSLSATKATLQAHIDDDLDTDPTNEFQSLTWSGDSLLISDGNGVSLVDYAKDTQIDSLGGLIDDNLDSLIAHRGDLDALADSIADHRIDIDANADSLFDLRQDIDANTDSIIAHRIDIDNNLDSIDAHRIELDDMNDSITAHRFDIDDNLDSILVLRSDLDAHVNSDYDTDTLNEAISTGFESGDTLYIVEGGDTFAFDLGGLSVDTLPLIRSNDSSVIVSTLTADEVEITIDDTIRYRFLKDRLNLNQPSVYIGNDAGLNDGFGYGDSVANVAIGYRALRQNAGVWGAVAIGSEALENNSFGGAYNTAVGNQAMKNVSNGQDNVAIGARALKNGSNPNGNVAIGQDALLNQVSGNGNVAVGRQAGSGLINGGGNVFLGAGSGSAETGSDKLYIDNNGTSAPLIYGNFAGDSLRIHGTFEVANSGGDLLTYPTTDGDSGDVLITDGLGNLSFSNPTINDNDWDTTGGNVVLYDSSDFVGIGTSTPGSRLEVVTTDSVNAVFSTNNVGANVSSAIEAYGNGDGAFTYGVFSIASGSANNRGLYGYGAAPSDSGFASGTEGWAHDSTTIGINYGVYGDAQNSTRINRGVVGVIRGNNSLADGAVYGIATGGGGGKSVALYGRSAFPNFGGGTNYGLYTRAQFADTNYAAYFESGAVYVGDSLIIPNGASPGLVLTSDAAGNASWQTSVGDDLGDHTLDSNLNLNGQYLSGDGDNEGIQIDTGGNIGIGTAPATNYRLRMDGRAFITTDPAEFVTVQSYGGGFEVLDPTPPSHVRILSDNGGPFYRSLLQTTTGHNTAEFSSDGYGDSAHIYSSGNLIFEAGGYTNARMIVNAVGNVGIGNGVSPDSLLDVFGGARVQSLNINSAYTFPTSDGVSNDVLITDGSGSLNFVDPSTIFSTDTLDRIKANDTNELVMNVGSITANFDNVDAMTLTPSAIRFNNPGDIFIGTSLTGQADAAGYVQNVGIGSQALQESVSLPGNTAIGARTLQNLTSGGYNTAIGRWAGVDFSTGTNNVFLGNYAGGAILEGSQNVMIGAEIDGTGLSSTTASMSGVVKLGYQAGRLDTSDNKLYIDNSSTTQPLIWGDFANDILQVGGSFRTDNLAGDILIYPGSDGTNGQVLTTDGSGNLSFQNVTGDTDWDTLGNYVYNLNDSIGIGTGSPTQPLDVNGDAIFWNRVGVGTDPQANGGQFNVFGSDTGATISASTEGSSIGLYATADNGATDTSFAIVSNPASYGSTEYSFYGKNGVLFNQGAVGIGTDNPARTLDVVGDAFIDSIWTDSLVIGNGVNEFAIAGSAGSNGDVLTYNAGIGEWQPLALGDSSRISDGDFDTKIQVEEGVDDDLIRFDVAGNETYLMDGRRLHVNNTGNSVYIGANAGNADNSGSKQSVAIGDRALENNGTGTSNVAVGRYAQRNTTSGYGNVAMGESALYSNVGGNGNTAIGNRAGILNSNASSNTLIGFDADFNNTAGSNNTLLGYEAGRGPGSHTKSGNIFIGYRAGYNDTTNNKLYIENSNSASPLIWGDFSNDVLQVGGSFRTNNLAGDTLIYPGSDGANGEVLTTDGSGNLSFQPVVGGDSDWDSLANIVYNLNDSVVVGDSIALARFTVNTTNSGTGFNAGIASFANGGTDARGIIGQAENGTAQSRGVSGYATGSPFNYAIHGELDAAAGETSYGVYARANGTSPTGTKYGLFATAPDPNGTNYAAYFDVGKVLFNDTVTIPTGAANGLVLTSDAAGNASWQSPQALLWDTTGSLLSPVDTSFNIGIKTTNSVSDFQFGDDVHLWRYNEPGNDSGLVITHNVDQNIQYTNSSRSNLFVLTESGIQLIAVDSQPAGTVLDLDNQDHARLEVKSNGVAINSDNPDAALDVQPVVDSLAIKIRPHLTSAGILGFVELQPAGGNYVGIKAPDTVDINYLITLPDTTPLDNQLLVHNASKGRLEWQTPNGSTCPSGYAIVNANFCIETTARTGDNWFAASDTCTANDAKLPTWSEWYAGTQVTGVDWSGTNAWEWLDQASLNNASIVGGGVGATIADERQTVAADNPNTPANTVQYRCIYRLKN